ncbi:hypothetical protein UFOVP1040_17 [uncultured Caudovirales phage]|uniref:Uncharacterized protein n=1 Tax=uncultured Caudovirales phage TaxID=2100421 RepID=A0A6J5QK40_9CAUD|nr:hypothetical protein UFOVP1040_17 [uncultured Caudovirales phage]
MKHSAWVYDEATSTPAMVVWRCAACMASVGFVREGTSDETPTSGEVTPPENIDTYANKDCAP